MERLHAESVAIFSKLTDASLQEKCVTVGKLEITPWNRMRSIVEQEIHHLGQQYVQQRILGVPVLSLYGLASEEPRARSKVL